MDDSSPFAIDDLICRAAEAAGYPSVTREQVIDVDGQLLPDEYWSKRPDYYLIRKHSKQGIVIPGVKLTDEYKYILSKSAKGQN